MSDTSQETVDTSKVPVGPNNDPTKIIEALYSLGPHVTAQWLEENADKMPLETAQKVLDYFYHQPDAAPGIPETAYMRQDSNSKAMQRYIATHPDVIKQQAQQAAEQTGADTAVVKGQIESGLDPKNQNVVFPSWLLSLNGGPPSDDQVAQMLASWNEINGSNLTDKVQLMQAMQAQSPVANIVAQEAILGSDPDATYTWRLADGSVTQVQRSQYDMVANATGYDLDTKETSRLIRLADSLGMSRETTPGSGQKLVDFVPVMHMAKYMNITSNLQYDTGKQRSAGGGEAARVSGVNEAANDKYLSNIQALTNMVVSYQQNLAVHGNNVGLALLATVQPALASRLSSTPASKWTPADVRAANQVFIDTGLMPDTSTAWGKEGYATDTGLTVDILTGTGNPTTSGGGGGYSRTMPDPVAIRQSAKDLYRQMFAADPTEAQLDGFVGQVQGAISGAPANQNVDGSARLRAALEGNSLYRELYGNMPAGMTESEYQNQFRQGAASMLGSQAADPTAIQSGMRSGDYQTTVGSVAGDKKSWGNSTFLGRLAQAAQMVAENT